jgi:hypothetical protein
MTPTNNPPPVTPTNVGCFIQACGMTVPDPKKRNTMPTPTWQTFVAYFLAALGAGIGWSLGNLVVVFLSRVILSH